MMGETFILSLLLLTKKALDTFLEKGIAISAAAVRRENQYDYEYKVTDWDNRCKTCLKEDENETDKGAGS